MLAEGFTTRRGGAARTSIMTGESRLRARRGARLAALTSGGAIPDIGDYRVILEPTETFVGTLNEDFAIESAPGDIFQLGNRSYLIQKVESGQVRVVDAQGQPPSIPFWLARRRVAHGAVAGSVRLRRDVDARLGDTGAAITWLAGEIAGVTEPAARQMVEYLDASKKILGVTPTQETLVLDGSSTSGGMQLVLHAPFGSRVNRAGVSRFASGSAAASTSSSKRRPPRTRSFCRSAQHSFPLESVFQYLKPDTAEHLLVQAMLDAPMFGSRWRWNATRALAVLRARAARSAHAAAAHGCRGPGGRRIPRPARLP